MQGARQQIILEFFEKLFATLALGVASAISPAALISLASRRIAWRKYVAEPLQAKTIALREVALLVAPALGLIVARALGSLPFEPEIVSAFFLILSFGCMLLGERSSLAVLPRINRAELRGAALRNLFGWAILGMTCAAFLKGASEREMFLAVLTALAGAGLSVLLAYRRGEPGLLIPGAAAVFVGILLRWPILVGAGAGLVLPATVLVTHNLKVSFALRGWVTALASGLALLFVATEWAWGGAAIVLILSFELWRFTIRLLVFSLLRTFYRFHAYGKSNTAVEGAAIVVSNHLTLVDGFLLGAWTERMVRFLVYDAFYKNPIMRAGLHLFRTIPISQGARREVVESLREARARIEEGHFAGIFPEGGISRSGHLHVFQKGYTRIVAGTAIPIIPAYMNGLWTSLLSLGEQKMNLRVPRFFTRTDIEFGAALPSSTEPPTLWRAVKHLEVNAVFRDARRAPILPLAFLKAARRHSPAVAFHSVAGDLSYGELATDGLLFARHINRRISRKQRVGVFLGPAAERVVAHVAIALAGHVAMEVPAQSETDFAEFVAAHGLSWIVTSHAWLDRHEVAKTDSMFFIGRALEKFDARDRARTQVYRMLSPQRAWRQVCAMQMRKESAVAIVRSPRGPVVLSHRGLWSAAFGVRRVLWFRPGTVVRSSEDWTSPGALLLGLWTPLLNGAAIAFEESDCDYEVIGAARAGAASPRSKHVLVLESEAKGASEADASALGERYLPVLELAEASGVLSISSPAVRFAGETQTGTKAGTLGRLLHGLEIEETADGVRLRGPARFLRYLDRGEFRVRSNGDDWVECGLKADLNDQAFVERRAISLPKTSSTPPEDRMPSNPPGE